MNINLIGTVWVCQDVDSEFYNLRGMVTDGEYHPDFNGDNEIAIYYQNGRRSEMKYRRFSSTHTRLAFNEEE